MAHRLQLVADVFDAKLDDIMSPERGCQLVIDARAAAYFFLCKLASHKEVGKIMGGRSAHGVRLAVNKVPKRRREDERFGWRVARIVKMLGDAEKGGAK